MAVRLMGIETEYAVTPGGQYGNGSNTESLAFALINASRRKFAHMYDSTGAGVFLANGGRLYVDCGAHPEYATPECSSPWEAVRHVEAGHAIVASLVSTLSSATPPVSAEVFRCNVNYGGALSTWGCHESYGYRADPRVLPREIIPHLVTRILYAGAGGFNPMSSLEFVLSPRAPFIEAIMSESSTHARGIFHTKNESLSSPGYNRLHVLFGESLCSHTSALLKIGATALIVALIDGGVRPAEGIALKDPLAALRTLATDVTCKAEIGTLHGRGASAIDIQRHYLEQVERHAEADFMPEWTSEVCRLWTTVLDRFTDAPGSLSTTLDWAIKYALYSNRLSQKNLDWPILADLRQVITKLNKALHETEFRGKDLKLKFVVGRESPIPDTIHTQERWLKRKNLAWGDVQRFLDIRHEIYETDMRFGQLGQNGIFAQLDRAGVLSHRIPAVGSIEDATEHPPEIGRARLRGEIIRRFSGNPKYRCDWQVICGPEGRLNLADPFETTERWQAP